MNREVIKSVAESMVQQARSAGKFPAFFLMNSVTFDQYLAEVRREKDASVSLMGHMLSRLGPKQEVNSFTLAGLPVVKTTDVPVGGIFLHLAPPIPGQQETPNAPGAPSHLSSPDQERGQANAGQGSPFWRTQAVPESPDKPSINDLIQGDNNGRPTVTDVLMKAIEGAESMKNVVVIRVYHNGDIDLSTNLDPFALQGVTQTAHLWAMQNGGRG